MLQRRNMLALLVLLIVAALFRLIGIDYGLPHPLVSDEEILIGGALRMAQTGSFIPSLDPGLAAQLYYPVGLPYAYLALFAPAVGVLFMVAGFPSFSEFQGVLLENLDVFFLLARGFGAALSVATIWLVYRLASSMFVSPLAGLVAAAMLSVSWFHVLLGHFSRHWSATVFFTWLVVWLAWRYYETPTVRRATWCGMAAAAGFAVGYIAVLGYAAFGLAHLMLYRRNFINRSLLWGLSIFGAGVLVAGALHLPAIERLIGGTAPILPVDEAKSLGGYWETLTFYIGALWWAEPVLLVSGTFGALLSFRRFPFLVFSLTFAVFSYTVFLDFFMPLEDRYILPAIPSFALLAGAGAVTIQSSFGRFGVGMRVYQVVLLLSLAFSGWNAVTLDRLLAADDTREQALKWVTANVVPGSGVVVLANPVKLNTSVEGLRAQDSLASATLDFHDRFALEREPQGLFRVVHLNRFDSDALEGFAAEKLLKTLRSMDFRYFIIAHRHDLERSDFHSLVAKEAQPIQVFQPFSSGPNEAPPDLRTTTLVGGKSITRYSNLNRLGPRVDIYEFR